MGHLENIATARAQLTDAESNRRKETKVRQVNAAREHLMDVTLAALEDGVTEDQIGHR